MCAHSFDLQQQPDGETTPDIVPQAGLEHAEEEGRTHHMTYCCCCTSKCSHSSGLYSSGGYARTGDLFMEPMDADCVSSMEMIDPALMALKSVLIQMSSFRFELWRFMQSAFETTPWSQNTPASRNIPCHQFFA
ncbi:hypothetical protein M405DRAFT_117031 [Rhizopogon salebrosus TDB-379]|nr:hypothetical protein M405DRAFT_117031 [Rhizopogon salebrosus TDB-379]